MTRLLQWLVPIETRHWLNARTGRAFGTFALLMHAVFVDVVIHPFFFTVHCIVPMLIPGGLLGAFVFFRSTRKSVPSNGHATGVLAMLVLPFVAAPFFWLVFAKTPAWTAALLFGEPHSEMREFHVQPLRSKSVCGYRAEVVDGLRLYPGYLCVSGAYASQHGGQRVMLRLSGDRTALGFRITDIEHVPSP